MDGKVVTAGIHGARATVKDSCSSVGESGVMEETSSLTANTIITYVVWACCRAGDLRREQAFVSLSLPVADAGQIGRISVPWIVHDVVIQILARLNASLDDIASGINENSGSI